MNNLKFTAPQIAEMCRNPHVIKCSTSSISYSKQFKADAIKKYYEEGYSANEIFRAAGFDLHVIGKSTPKDRLKNWRKIYKTKGIHALVTENRGRSARGRHLKTQEVSDADKIKRLEAEIAYLKAENDFLGKLRATRME